MIATLISSLIYLQMISRMEYYSYMKILTRNGELTSFEDLSIFGKRFIVCTLHLISSKSGQDPKHVLPTIKWIGENTNINLSSKSVRRFLQHFVVHNSVMQLKEQTVNETLTENEEMCENKDDTMVERDPLSIEIKSEIIEHEQEGNLSSGTEEKLKRLQKILNYPFLQLLL